MVPFRAPPRLLAALDPEGGSMEGEDRDPLMTMNMIPIEIQEWFKQKSYQRSARDLDRENEFPRHITQDLEWAFVTSSGKRKGAAAAVIKTAGDVLGR